MSPDDIGEREAEIYLEMLRTISRGLFVLAALGGAGLSASHFGLV